MNTRARTTTRSQPMKAPIANGKGRLPKSTANAAKGGRAYSRDRTLALQKDIDRLKKKLWHEQNIHRALERAFNRPLGALPRLPPYLPPDVLGLLAEVAVLEEEIVRLEELIVHYRQDLYQEAVYLSSSKRRMENSTDANSANPTESPTLVKLKSLFQTVGNPATSVSVTTSTATFSDDWHGKENQSCTNSCKSSKQSSCKAQTTRTPIKKLPTDNKSVQKRWSPRKRQQELRMNDQLIAEVRNPRPHENIRGDVNPNIISENILKCLSTILMRMSSVKNPSPMDDKQSLLAPEIPNCVEGTEFYDPYGICLEFGKRDIGPYNQLCAIESKSFNPKRTANSLILLRRLKYAIFYPIWVTILLSLWHLFVSVMKLNIRTCEICRIMFEKLASVYLENLNHQEKLAFWINVYNSCMMNAFIENGIPESPELVVALMREATINVGGHLLSANTIEHFILRLPYHSKFTFSKGAKNHEMTARSIFGLELSEPLVTFALSCGTWSSPAVRVYTASQVENQLEVAKKEYLQAAIGISTSKFAIPKLLDWYLLDFAKDLESLLDWICLQLPIEVRKEAINLFEKRKIQPLSQFVQIIPYDFRFRYLLCT